MGSEKIYYLETNALYALSGCFAEISEVDIEVATSLFALQEIVDGIKEEDFHKRKVLLSKIMSYKLKIYPFLPVECVAIAFFLDISDFPEILCTKEILIKKINMAIRADNYWDYHNKLLNAVRIDENEVKKHTDQFEVENKKKISAIVDAERKSIDKLHKEQKTNPQYIKIDINEVFGIESDGGANHQSVDNVTLLLRKLLDSIHIQYRDADIFEKVKERDKKALVAMLLGVDMYSTAKSFKVDRKQADRNDLNDLMHLLYLRDKNHIIVSDDKIYSSCTMKTMRMGINEFKNIVNRKKAENISRE